MGSHKLPFGMQDGRLLHISEVDRGLACNCICPSCSHPLVARKGDHTVHHFAHHKGKECEHGFETALHIATKEILERNKKIIVPRVEVDFFYYNRSWLISGEREIIFDDVELERKYHDVIPDVIGYINGKPLMIEVTVTHKTGEEKIQKVRERGISILEIDLSKFNRIFSIEELEKEVILNTENKKWLLNIKEERIRAMALYLSEHLISDDGWISCPIKYGKDTRVHESDCEECRYFLGFRSFYNEYLEGDHPHMEEIEYIVCLSKSGIRNIKDFYRYLLKSKK